MCRYFQYLVITLCRAVFLLTDSYAQCIPLNNGSFEEGSDTAYATGHFEVNTNANLTRVTELLHGEYDILPHDGNYFLMIQCPKDSFCSGSMSFKLPCNGKNNELIFRYRYYFVNNDQTAIYYNVHVLKQGSILYTHEPLLFFPLPSFRDFMISWNGLMIKLDQLFINNADTCEFIFRFNPDYQWHDSAVFL